MKLKFREFHLCCGCIIVLCPFARSNSSPQIEAADSYVAALSRFQRNVSGFANLLITFKSLITSFEIWRPDEFTALLWAFPSTRRDLFPYSQYKINDSKLLVGRVDVLLLRADRTLFAMTVKGRKGAPSSLKSLVQHFENFSTSYYPFKSGKQLVKHRVFIGLGYTQLKNKSPAVTGSYVSDTLDLSKKIKLTV